MKRVMHCFVVIIWTKGTKYEKVKREKKVKVKERAKRYKKYSERHIERCRRKEVKSEAK